MVGEMRDMETIGAALTGAETGHLVLTTLHTNDAPQTIDRIVDTFPPYQQNQIRIQLANTLVGILSRRLVPKIGGGVINAVELLIVNSAVKNLIRENKIYQIPSVIETSFEDGMLSLNRSLAELVKKEEISMDSALNVSANPNELKLIV
jgi:twitching motility protein PilT